MAVIDIGRYLFTVHAMTTVMTNAQRSVLLAYGVGSSQTLPSGCFDFSTWSATANRYSSSTDGPPPGLDPTLGTVIAYNLSNYSGWGTQQMRVTVRYPFVPITPWLSLLTGELVASGDQCASTSDDRRLMEQATYTY